MSNLCCHLVARGFPGELVTLRSRTLIPPCLTDPVLTLLLVGTGQHINRERSDSKQITVNHKNKTINRKHKDGSCWTVGRRLWAKVKKSKQVFSWQTGIERFFSANLGFVVSINLHSQLFGFGAQLGGRWIDWLIIKWEKGLHTHLTQHLTLASCSQVKSSYKLHLTTCRAKHLNALQLVRVKNFYDPLKSNKAPSL